MTCNTTRTTSIVKKNCVREREREKGITYVRLDPFHLRSVLNSSSSWSKHLSIHSFIVRTVTMTATTSATSTSSPVYTTLHVHCTWSPTLSLVGQAKKYRYNERPFNSLRTRLIMVPMCTTNKWWKTNHNTWLECVFLPSFINNTAASLLPRSQYNKQQ